MSVDYTTTTVPIELNCVLCPVSLIFAFSFRNLFIEEFVDMYSMNTLFAIVCLMHVRLAWGQTNVALSILIFVFFLLQVNAALPRLESEFYLPFPSLNQVNLFSF